MVRFNFKWQNRQQKLLDVECLIRVGFSHRVGITLWFQYSNSCNHSLEDQRLVLNKEMFEAADYCLSQCTYSSLLSFSLWAANRRNASNLSKGSLSSLVLQRNSNILLSENRTKNVFYIKRTITYCRLFSCEPFWKQGFALTICYPCKIRLTLC